MNYPDRVKILRRTLVDVVDGTPVYSVITVYESTPCRFEILNATQAQTWKGVTTTGTYATTQANLRLPKTMPDIPQSGQVLTDYTVQVISPVVGWIKSSGTVNWKISAKRMTKTHVLYLIEV